jgi:serine/threonine protein kinase
MSILRSETRMMSQPVPDDDVRLQGALAAFAESWRKGERRPSEEFLDDYPDLAANPESAVRLIYEEICIRQEEGEHVSSGEFVRRFPQWKNQIEVLLGCHNLLLDEQTEVDYPDVNERVGEFQLLCELGRGAEGRVFLARELSLGGRPVVLKMTPRDGQEHISLARLQNTNIVPLYSMSEHPERNLRVLCMPCLGGTTLFQVLNDLSDKPLEQRHGRDILAVLDQQSADLPVTFEVKGPARAILARSNYVEALCWIGICLAEGLQYAHDRDLVHLDVKPSNILLASDGQPMLLDFHLAQAPLRPSDLPPPQIGGTREYMAPEQEQAMQAVRGGDPIVASVDGQADLYSLGVVLYEALGGILPANGGEPVAELYRCNREVSIGLSDVIQRMIARDAGTRYRTAAEAAADLRRHLNNERLLGVPNRSVKERWRKWRRRRPHALGIASFAAVLLIGMAIASSAIWSQARERRHLADLANTEGHDHMVNRRYREAVDAFSRGVRLSNAFLGDSTLRQSMEASLARAQRARNAQDLHTVVDLLRFTFAAEPVPTRQMGALEPVCRDMWNRRELVLSRSGGQLELEMERGVREDLFDLALFWGDIQQRLAPPLNRAQAKANTLQLLNELEQACGVTPALIYERERLVNGPEAVAKASLPEARTAWEHFALGRALFRSGRLDAARQEFKLAQELQPAGFWPTLYQGLTEYRAGKLNEAVYTFSICIGQSQKSPECYYLRARAFATLGQIEAAVQDLDLALRTRQDFSQALVQRARLNRRLGRYDAALADVQKALAARADPTSTRLLGAFIQLEKRDYKDGFLELLRALQSLNSPTGGSVGGFSREL